MNIMPKMTEAQAKELLKGYDRRLYLSYTIIFAVAYGIIRTIWPLLINYGAPGPIYKWALVIFLFWGGYNIKWVTKTRSTRDRLRIVAGYIPDDHHHGHQH